MRIVTAASLAILMALVGAWAQVGTGTYIVQVRDASGSVVPGASVTITHVDTGQVRQGATNDEGMFRVPILPVGNYTITAEAPGFRRQVMSGLDLRVDQNTTISIVLEPGELKQEVAVTGTAPLLEANTSSIGQVIDNAKILELPLNGRNAFALGLLSGNTTPVLGVTSNLPFVGGGGRFSDNEVMLDGVDNNTTATPNNIGRAGIAYTPSADAVQEFKKGVLRPSLGFGAILRSRVKLLTVAQFVACNFTFFISLSWMLPYLRSRYGLSDYRAAVYAMAPLLAGASAQWLAGCLVDRIYRSVLRSWSRRIPAMVGLSLAAAGVLGLTRAETAETALVCFTMAAFGVDMTVGLSFVLCADIAGNNTGSISAAVNMIATWARS